MGSLQIDRTWDGYPVRPEEFVHLELTESDDCWTARFDAPFHGDPPPESAAGRCDRLWEFEVVELFLVGPDERYLELEFGPAGHYLGLELHGVRRIVDSRIPIDYEATRNSGRWRGVATIPADRIPRPVQRWNAFAIHGTGERRRYLVGAPLGVGTEPDFHRIDEFPSY